MVDRLATARGAARGWNSALMRAHHRRQLHLSRLRAAPAVGVAAVRLRRAANDDDGGDEATRDDVTDADGARDDVTVQVERGRFSLRGLPEHRSGATVVVAAADGGVGGGSDVANAGGMAVDGARHASHDPSADQ